ncbi:MAG: archaetidylserine decarboxylase [Candidatus Methylopumilus sp.]
MSNRLAVLAQYLLPKHGITMLAGQFANAKAGKLTTSVIRWFIKRYQVNMQEAAQPDIQHYKTFNDFFTRALRDGARPLATADFICPVDGAISQFGAIAADQIFQAKGHNYSTNSLLAGQTQLATKFENGSFATLYLSPKDYHRIHMPCDGHLKQMTYVPGSLFSVNPATAQGVPGLFARNERVICEFESQQHGTFVMILVGATIVGSMATVWHGVVNPPRSKRIREWKYTDQQIELKQGEEMGRFLLGSTVVMLFPNNTLQFNPDWSATRAIQVGEAMAIKSVKL